MKKKIISIVMAIFMVVAMVPLSGNYLEASALEKLDVLIWSPTSIPGYSEEEANIIKGIYNNLNLNQYASYGTHSLSQISQLYDLSELKFVLVYEPALAINSSDLNMLKDFNESGIHIMFMGEHYSYSSNNGNINSNISAAASSLGFNVAFSTNQNVSPNDFTISVNSESPLFKNVTSLGFAAACIITNTDDATEQLAYNNQVCFVGKQVGNGYISVVSDCNIFNYSTTANVTQLLKNCYEIGQNSTHTFETVVTAPTCAEQGYTTYTCSECGYSYVGNYVDALGHDVVWKTIFEPTCTTDGAKVKGCSRCDAEEVVVLLDSSTYPQSPHSYSNNMNRTYNFSYEGAEKLVLTFSANTSFESNYDYLYIYDSNGTQIGRYSGTSLASKVITINGDNFSLKLTTDSSVTNYGFSFSKIEAYMNVADTEEIIPATGHTEEILPSVEPTCTETGLTEGKKCTVCGEVLVEQTVIDALGHSIEILPAVEPSCTETGLTEGQKCTVCGETLVEQTVVEALGHTEETIVGVVPTCIDSGISDGIKCTVCGEILLEQKTLPPTGHTRVTVPGKAPTCTEDGYTDSVKCSVCNEVLVEASVLKATHTRVAITAKAPTCVEEGHTEGVKCAVCDEILVAPTVIEKTAHADNDSDGYCDNCSFIVNQDLIEKNCNCDCHGNNFMFRFILFFQRLFGLNKYCACGIAHY